MTRGSIICGDRVDERRFKIHVKDNIGLVKILSGHARGERSPQDRVESGCWFVCKLGERRVFVSCLWGERRAVTCFESAERVERGRLESEGWRAERNCSLFVWRAFVWRSESERSPNKLAPRSPYKLHTVCVKIGERDKRGCSSFLIFFFPFSDFPDSNIIRGVQSQEAQTEDQTNGPRHDRGLAEFAELHN